MTENVTAAAGRAPGAAVGSTRALLTCSIVAGPLYIANFLVSGLLFVACAIGLQVRLPRGVSGHERRLPPSAAIDVEHLGRRPG